LNRWTRFSNPERPDRVQPVQGRGPAAPDDILEGKKTLLLREAYDHLVDVDRSFLQLCLSTRTSNDASVSKIEQLIDKSGAVGLLTQRMESLFQKAELHSETRPSPRRSAKACGGFFAGEATNPTYRDAVETVRNKFHE